MDAAEVHTDELRTEDRSPTADDSSNVQSKHAKRSKQSRLTAAIASATTNFKADCYRAATEAIRRLRGRNVEASQRQDTSSTVVRKLKVGKQSAVRESHRKVAVQQQHEDFS